MSWKIFHSPEIAVIDIIWVLYHYVYCSAFIWQESLNLRVYESEVSAEIVSVYCCNVFLITIGMTEEWKGRLGIYFEENF